MELDINYLKPQQRNKSKGIKTYYGGIVENGQTRWVSLKTKNLSVAMEWFAKMQASRFSPQKQISSIKMKEAIEAFMADVEKVRRRSECTIAKYGRFLRFFSHWCEGKGILAIENVTAKACSEYVIEKLAGKSKNYAKTNLVVLRQFFKWVSIHYDLSMRNPFGGIVSENPKPEPRKFWTVEECEKIIEFAKTPEHGCWYALMAFAGLRREEARLLRTESIKGGKISLVGKGSKFATVPISKRLEGHINNYMALRGDHPGLMFPILADSSGRNLERNLRVVAKKAEVSNAETAHYHRFRHSFASNLLRAGRNIKAVQTLMRHENVNITLNVYGHLLPSDLEKDVEL